MTTLYAETDGRITGIEIERPDGGTERLGVARLQAGQGTDPFGRDFTAPPRLAPPFFAVRATGALFHTQGGLMIDQNAAVRRAAGNTTPNLFAGGGAACGVSGPDIAGYLSGSGRLTAVAFGALAGVSAARCAQAKIRG